MGVSYSTLLVDSMPQHVPSVNVSFGVVVDILQCTKLAIGRTSHSMCSGLTHRSIGLRSAASAA